MDGAGAIPELTKWWLKEGSIYGVAVVFLVIALLMLVWFVGSMIRLAQKWVPLWFEKNIESHEKVCRALDTFCTTLDGTSAKVDSTHDGFHGAIRAVNAHLSDKANAERLGVKSDVIFQLKDAERVMRVKRRLAADDTVQPRTGEAGS